MNPCAYTHRESGDNLLLGTALLEAWERQDRTAFETLLATEGDDLFSAVVGVCRAANLVIGYLQGAGQPKPVWAFNAARAYGLMRRDELGGDDETNLSNLEG